MVAISKPGLMFFLNRETGRSVYPVEERPCHKATRPAKKARGHSHTAKPAPLARQGMTADEIFTGKLEHEKFCRDLAARIGGIHNYGPYTPYSSREIRIIFPGRQGSPDYGGVAVDPSLGYVFVNSRMLLG